MEPILSIIMFICCYVRNSIWDYTYLIAHGAIGRCLNSSAGVYAAFISHIDLWDLELCRLHCLHRLYLEDYAIYEILSSRGSPMAWRLCNACHTSSDATCDRFTDAGHHRFFASRSYQHFLHRNGSHNRSLVCSGSLARCGQWNRRQPACGSLGR